jgi:3',5'-cyclic AMP phosphodiesterase CpdA
LARIHHLSDLHLLAEGERQDRLLKSLVAALAREASSAGEVPELLVVTGDVFDSATVARHKAVAHFTELHAAIMEAYGREVPTVVLPGNHDRRRGGVIGPHRPQLFHALRAAVDPARVHVAGCKTPILAEIVPESFHRLAAHVVAFDSTYLPRGLFSAGGIIRLEDLLRVAATIGDDAKDRPLILLIHHHLIPTPLTDVSEIEPERSNGLGRWALSKLLPALVANAEHEELTMTALGAGTALTTLHAFGRAVMILHGHKHYPTARLLDGTLEGSGDLLITSAGTAGRSERFQPTRQPEAPRLWPSFNVVHLDDDRVTIDAVSFSPKNSKRSSARRRLVDATRHEARWHCAPVPLAVVGTSPRVLLDEVVCTLVPSRDAPLDLWDVRCERKVERISGARLRRYSEFIHGLPGARIREVDAGGTARPATMATARLDLALDATTTYRLEDGLCRSMSAASRAYGRGTAYEWVGLLSRYGAARARLVLHHGRDVRPFASVTDLTTGREQPATLARSDGVSTLEVAHCAPRTLLRTYWELEA